MTYFFYDLETSGFNPREARIMQFAGQRTNEQCEPIGDPVNLLIKLAPDVLPSPEAIFITHLTPQQTIQNGLTEVEFLQFFYDQIVTPDTIFLGYNSVRFDDEFMRFLHYRNFYDAYEWQWVNNCSRWDLLDVVRMMRALRPDGIIWPINSEGKPTNRLELLSKANGLDHVKAHDALSDVQALIAVAKLLKTKQPNMYEYLLSIRKKDKVRAIIETGQPFTYTSSHFSSDYLHTTIASLLVKPATNGDGAIVYDLRYDPTPYLTLSVEELVERWQPGADRALADRLPLKTIKYNRCPALAAGVVKDAASLQRLGLSLDIVTQHFSLLQANQTEFVDRVLRAKAVLDERQAAAQKEQLTQQNVDSRLYDGFCGDADKALCRAIRAAQPAEINSLGADFHDQRYKLLAPLYKARNFPASLTTEERASWDSYCAEKLLTPKNNGSLAQYFNRLRELAESPTLTEEKGFLLEELQLYGESIVPADADY